MSQAVKDPPTMKNIHKPWILAGYALMAKEGPQALKVEVIARQVGKNKSSFYHHFADLDIFISHLLSYHLERSKIISDEERKCKNVVPELLNVILDHKQDLLFNRQLRVNRENPAFEACFTKASQEVGEAIVGIWAEALGLSGNSDLAMMVLTLSIENFYLQITDKTLTFEWLKNYVFQLRTMVERIRNSQNYQSIKEAFQS